MVRFDKPCLKVSGAVEYFREHMVGDYLTEAGAAEMSWYGAGAARVGFSGPCRLDDFEALCTGHRPSGEKLLLRDKGGARRVCYFAQISAPKDVSIAHLVGGDTRIAAWWRDAVHETLREIETFTATRVRLSGSDDDRTTGEMIAAVVTHDTNRALDPQLHTHVCIMNLTFDPVEARWKSVQPFAYFRHQGFFREVCYNKLAAKMLAGGYELDSARGLGFHVRGFPPELRERFSKRRREILRQAQADGAKSQDELQAITARTRDEKTRATAAQLREGWLHEAGEEGNTMARIIEAAIQRSVAAPITPAPVAMQSAEAHVFERRSVIDEPSLLREALIAARGTVELRDLRRALHQRVDSGELIRDNGNIGSRDALQAESEFLAWAERNRRSCAPLGAVPALASLSEDQAGAVTRTLRSPARVTILQGDAGTGKTTCLRAVVSGIAAGGNAMFGCAPSTAAAEVLRHELTPAADTLQQLLANPALQEKTRGHVLVVDEAGLISVRQMRDLCRLAAANNNRLLLVGDTKQHSSVEAGDALRCLQQSARVPVARLKEIRRQHNPAYRSAVARLARGDALGALNRFVKLGAVHEIQDPRRLFARAADTYVETTRAGKSCLVISPVWAEIHAFTAEVRERLKASGILSRDEHRVTTIVPLDWTREECRRITHYQPGDVLTFHRPAAGFERNETAVVVRRDGPSLILRRGDNSERRLAPHRVGGFDVGLAQTLPVATGDRLLLRANLKPAGLRNGEIVQVAAVAADGAISLADGRTIPSSFRCFTHGYATTSHAAQGKTVQHGILLMGDEGIAAGNLKQAYVSNSRFQESQTIYTTDLQAARLAMQRPADRLLATEFAPPSPSPARRYYLSRLFRHPRPSAQTLLYRHANLAAAGSLSGSMCGPR